METVSIVHWTAVKLPTFPLSERPIILLRNESYRGFLLDEFCALCNLVHHSSRPRNSSTEIRSIRYLEGSHKRCVYPRVYELCVNV